ncbi:MAG: multifunctional CCA addition/repair protein [Gammaproteobacteria bacterium]|nr:multifunctional CCA addition/repair protein [Gammaproteobacteria bacterium]
MRCYRVGGAVRDRLLGCSLQDCDWVVVGATEQEMLALGFKRVGADFPVFLHPRTREEYALARTERKSGSGYKGFTAHASPDVTLEEDLLRRDLTINAMAEDEQGAIIDPYGGQRDLAARVLRHVSPAFVEDPLRVLRVARFAARFAFTVAPETMALMRRMSDGGELDTLVPERVWSELQRALAEPHPEHFIMVLRDCGALRVLLPWLDCLFGVPQPAAYHPEIDTGEHILLVLREAAAAGAATPVRFAALVHDLGKGTTPREQWPRHVGHEERGVALIRELAARYEPPRAYLELALLAARLHGVCHRALELRPGTILDLFEQLDALRRPERFLQFLEVCELDYRGRGWSQRSEYPQARYLSELRELIAKVDISDLVAAGTSGERIAAAMRERRLEILVAATGRRSG